MRARWSVVLVATSALAAGGCGDKKPEESDLGREAQAACTGSRLSTALNLPPSFPQIKELEGAGFAILFNELEEHDSEISWKGEGRTGQVAMREECGEPDKTYVHVTNRPAE